MIRSASLTGGQPPPRFGHWAGALLLSIAVAGTSADAWAAGTFYVDNANPACSNSGAGTLAQPYCTISAASSARGGAGTTIVVRPGTYREMVTVGASGSSSAPFVIQAPAAGVTVEGADDLSNSTLWTKYSGNVWLARSVTAAPKQVFLDGARLTVVTSSPASIAANSFRWVSGAGLYVNIGGANPGTRSLLAGKRLNGFKLSGRTWVTIQGFTVAHTDERAFYLSSSSYNCTIDRNVIRSAFGNGIYCTSSSTGLVISGNDISDCSDYGILVSGGSGATVRDNTVARSTKSGAVAYGIQMTGSTNARLERNRVFSNTGSGIALQSSSHNAIVVQNQSWDNGDFGYSQVSSTGARYVGDVAWRNADGGFTLSSGSTGSTIVNCISADNNAVTAGFDLSVDSGSISGFHSEYNVYWMTDGRAPVRYVNTNYATVAAFTAATSQDAQTRQADPKFVNPAIGDFHLRSGSPAIDAANASTVQWPATDAEGRARLDDWATANSGLGSVAYADRGAYEYVSVNAPPTAALAASPASGPAPLAVTLDASGSRDPDGVLASYRFDFGDGSTAGPQSSPTATHPYAAGRWIASVTVTDAGGLTAAATTIVNSTAPPSAALTLTPTSGVAPLAVTADASGSQDPNHDIATYRFDFGDGTVVGPQASPIATHTFAAGSWTVAVTVIDSTGGMALAASALVASPPPNVSPIAVLSVTPGLGLAPLAVSASAAGSRDPDGTLLTYRFNFGDGTVVGPQTQPTAAHTFAAGRWTVTLTATDSAGATASQTALIVVNAPPVAALRLTPTSGVAPLAVTADASASTDAEGNVASYRFDFGDGTVVGPQAGATATHTYAAGHWNASVTVTDDRAATASASATATANAAPVAALTVTPSSGTAPLAVTADASASTDADGTLATYRFDFGDGTIVGPQVQPTATHVFAPGQWLVRVTVADDSAATSTQTRSVTVNAPPLPALSVTPATGAAPLAVSASAAGTNDTDGRLLTYRFDFGDGVVAGPQASTTATHTYAAGHWTTTLTVTDSAGATATKTVAVWSDTPPVAALAFSPSGGTAPLAVSADASGSSDSDGTLASYRFDFGDGTVLGPQPGNTAAHTYAAGHWTATVTVTDDAGVTLTTTRTIDVNAPPVAALTLAPGSGVAPLAVLADASASSDPDGAIASFRFDFGDGTVLGPQAAPTATHTYAAGSWTATVTVTDAAGAASTRTATIVVAPRLNQLPTPALQVTPLAGTAPLAVSANASGSNDPDGVVVSYRFDFGDGTIVGPQASSTATHTYAAGNWTTTVTVTDDSSATASTSKVVHANAPPVAGLSVSPTAGIAPLAVLANASSSFDLGGTIASYRFDFGDGTVVGPQASASATHTYAAGNWTASVTVTDGEGATATTTALVAVNARPVAALSVTPASGDAPLAVTASAAASSDADGVIASYRFDFGDGTVVGPQASASAPHTYAAGSWTASVTVLDDLGASATIARSVVVNAPPSAALTVTPASGTAPLAVTADASASSDLDGAIASYRFDFGDGSLVGPQAGATATHTYATGNWTASVTVTDANGATAIRTASVAVNVRPVAALAVTPNAGPAPLAVTADASASSDADGSVASYRFDFGDGTIVGPQASATATHTYTTGHWTASLTVTDDRGASATANAAVDVDLPPNQSPSAALDVTPASGLAPLAITADASASSDLDGTIASYRFDFGDGTVVGPQASASATHSYAAGNWTASVTVLDNRGGSGTTTRSVAVNAPPVAALGVTPASGLAPLAITADASASSDPDGAVTTYRFDFGDGTVVGPQTNASATHTYAAGNWNASVTVTDDLGATATITRSVAVNASPVAALAVTPGAGITPLAVVADASASSDPDGAIATYRFDFGDGTIVGPQASASATHTYAAGSWSASVTVTDANGATATQTASVAVNARPIAALVVGPSTGASPLAVTADASGSSDPDGVVATYRFDFGDGTIVGPQASASATHTYTTGRWTASVVVTDGLGATASASASVDVDLPPNQDPTAALSVTPASGAAPLAVTASASASSDLDGTIVSYRFDFGDGTVVGPQVSPSATHTYAAGRWTASVTVTDDRGGSATALAGVAVNAPPVAVLGVTPVSGHAPLAVTADAAASSDPDGSVASYRFDFGDGTVVGPQTSASATHTYAAGSWTASLTVTDDLGATNTTTRSVAVNAPPVAALTLTPALGAAPLIVTADASASSDLDGGIASYRFDFGDGTLVGPQAGASATHTYAAGNWTASVTVTDASGATAIRTASVAVNAAPIAVLAVTPASGVAPLAITADASASSDPDGAVASYAFDFGDGTILSTQEEATAVHSYAEGNWTVTVTVTDDQGAQSTATFGVAVTPPPNQPPIALLSVRRSGMNPDSGFVAVGRDPWTVFTPPAVPRPPYLTPLADSIFRTPMMRITNLGGTTFTTATGGGTWGADARHHYSKDEPWNSDGTLIAVQNSGTPRQILLDGATYQPRYGECASYPRGDDRWHPSPQYPHVRINVKGNELMWYDVTTCTKLRSWTLPFVPKGIGDNEGNASLDGRFLALCDTSRMFVVDMDPQAPFAAYPNIRIGPVYTFADCGLSECRLGWVGVSPSGKFVVCKYGGDHPRVYDLNPNTLELTPRPMPEASPRCVGEAAQGFIYDVGHCDMALNPFDHNEDVLIGQEHCGNRGTYVGSQLMGGVVMVRLRDGAVTPLTDPTNESYPHHISTQNLDRPGWAYVGYYPEAGKRFSDEIVAVKMDGSQTVQRFAHKHSDTSGDCYRCEAHAVPSRDGRRMIWASNWAIGCTSCGSPSEIKDYVADARTAAAKDTSWTAPLTLTIDGSSSTDPDGTLASYTFDFGDGVTLGPQASAVATHTFGPGTWSIHLSVTDNRGATRLTEATVTVTAPPDRAPVVTAPTAASAPAGTPLSIVVTASDPDGNAITTLTANLATLPAGNNAQFTAGAGNTSGTLAWTPQASDIGGPYAIVFTVANAMSGKDTTLVTVTSSNLAPVAALSATPALGAAPLAVTLSAAASSDPDGTVASYLFDFGDGISQGPQAGATASHTYGVGTFTARVTVTDDQGATGTTTVTVRSLQNLCGNPSFETDMTGWNANGGPTLARVAGGYGGSWCLEMRGPASTATFGANDSPNFVSVVPAAGTVYRFSAWVRSAAHRGNGKMRIREYLNGTQQGPQIYSPSVVLSPTWQLVTYDYTTLVAGSTIDFQVVDAPLVNSEIFQTDMVSVIQLPAGSALMASSTLEGGVDLPAALEPAPAAAPALELSVRVHSRPGTSGTSLDLVLPHAGPVSLTLHDVQGRVVRQVLDGVELAAGAHEVRFDGSAVALRSGVYFFRLRSRDGVRAGRFVLLE